MTVWTLSKQSAIRSQVSARDFHDWHDQNDVFESMAYYTRAGFPSPLELTPSVWWPLK